MFFFFLVNEFFFKMFLKTNGFYKVAHDMYKVQGNNPLFKKWLSLYYF